MAKGTAMTAVTPAKNRVFLMRGAIWSATVVRVPESSPTKLAKFAWANDVPKSPCKTPASHVKYRAIGG